METETGSKKVGDDGHESESNSSNAAIDLLPPEMLQSIYKFLPFKDLLVCREVNKKWKGVATDPVRKRCHPLAFSGEDLPEYQRSTAVQSFIELITATNEQGGLEEFPITEFEMDLNSDFYWIEKDGSTLISQFLEAISHFVKKIIFTFKEEPLKPNQTNIAIPHELAFPNLTKIALKVFGDGDQHKDSEIFSFIGKIVEKSPNVKEFQPQLYCRSEIRRCVEETGIEQKAKLVTSLRMATPTTENDFKYLSTLGFKLKDFFLILFQHDLNPEIFKTFLESQSDSLTSLSLGFGNGNSYQYFKELPCLPHLKNLSMSSSSTKKGERDDQLPILFYKELLPALKKMDLRNAQFPADYLIASHMAPSESLRELILPRQGIKDAGEFIRQVARLFPNLKKLQVSHASAGRYMSEIYEELPGIEELCILTGGHDSVDDIITGLPERLLHKIGDGLFHTRSTSYQLSKAAAMLERGMTETLAGLENLRILMIHRDSDGEDVGGADFTELSGIVFKQMKGLQQIDFGIRKFGPIVSAALKEDLETNGIKLLYQRPRYTRWRTDFIESLSESDESHLYSDF